MSEPAARKGDLTRHVTPLTGTGFPTVKICYRSAWRVGDVHTCAASNAAPPASDGKPHATGTVLRGSMSVLTGNQGAARKGDLVLEPGAVPPPFSPNNAIQAGCLDVRIGDVSFGVMAPAVVDDYCRGWRQLRTDWPTLTPEERRRRTEALLNNALTSADAAPLRGVTDEAAPSAAASFSPRNYQINMPGGFFDSSTAPDHSVGGTMLHEARHGEQWYSNGRYLAGSGSSAADISNRTGLHPDVARSAQGDPVAIDSQRGQLGRMNDQQNSGAILGEGRYNQQVRDAQNSIYHSRGPSSPEYRQALDHYWGLPNEADAESANAEFQRRCP